MNGVLGPGPRPLGAGWRPGPRRAELAPGTLSDGEQRPEGRRRKEGVARAPQHSLRPGYLVTKRAQEGRLAHSRLTAHHDHIAPPTAFHRGQRLLQHAKRARSLQQLVVRPALDGDNSSWGHVLWCTRADRVSTLARSPATSRNWLTRGDSCSPAQKTAPERPGTPDKTKTYRVTTRPAPRPSARPPRPTTFRSTGSPRSGS